MSNRIGEETTKIHFHIAKRDLERLDAAFCREGQRTVGRSRALRVIIKTYLDALERKTNAKPIPFTDAVSVAIDRGEGE